MPGGAATRAAEDKQTRYAVVLARQQPPVAFQAFAFETFGGLHADALALVKRLQGLLNQAIIAQEDAQGVSKGAIKFDCIFCIQYPKFFIVSCPNILAIGIIIGLHLYNAQLS